MSIRYIELNNEELKNLVEKKGEIVAKGRKHYTKMEKLHEEGNAIGEERNAIVNEIVKLVGEELKDEKLGEFEMANTTEIHNGKVRVAIIDRIAQIKEQLRDEKDKAERAEAGELTEAEVVKDNQTKVLEAMKQIPQEELAEKLEAILKVLE